MHSLVLSSIFMPWLLSYSPCCWNSSNTSHPGCVPLHTKTGIEPYKYSCGKPFPILVQEEKLGDKDHGKNEVRTGKDGGRRYNIGDVLLIEEHCKESSWHTNTACHHKTKDSNASELGITKKNGLDFACVNYQKYPKG